jgi:hypothetical protein
VLKRTEIEPFHILYWKIIMPLRRSTGVTNKKGPPTEAQSTTVGHLDMLWSENVYLACKQAVGNAAAICGYKPEIGLYRFAAECSYI